MIIPTPGVSRPRPSGILRRRRNPHRPGNLPHLRGILRLRSPGTVGHKIAVEHVPGVDNKTGTAGHRIGVAGRNPGAVAYRPATAITGKRPTRILTAKFFAAKRCKLRKS